MLHSLVMLHALKYLWNLSCWFQDLALRLKMFYNLSQKKEKVCDNWIELAF